MWLLLMMVVDVEGFDVESFDNSDKGDFFFDKNDDDGVEVIDLVCDFDVGDDVLFCG